jgi:Flp pilus assembly pilin Flp
LTLNNVPVDRAITDTGRRETGMRYLKAWWRGETGQTMAEYALILAAVAVVAIAGYTTMGTQVKAVLSTVNTSL